MATNDFKAFATGAGANVLTQPEFVALTALITNGFQSGTANSEQLNKVWRQSSVIASVIGDLIVKQTGQDVLDDGTPGTILTNLQAAILYSTTTVIVGGTANSITALFPYVPEVSDLVNGITFRFKATSSTTSTTPTFTPNSGTVPAKTIVKGNNLPLATSDILAGMWVSVIYDSVLDKWVLNNPSTGVATIVGDATETVKGISRFSTSVENIAGTSQLIALDPRGLREALNAAGSAPIYACRAWVKFNGGTILGSGNVSSVTSLGSGRWRVTFTSNIGTADYAVIVSAVDSGSLGTTLAQPETYNSDYVDVRLTVSSFDNAAADSSSAVSVIVVG